MKTTLLLLSLAASIGAAHAQDVYDSDYSQEVTPAAAVVYEAPVTYAAPVVYQAPVIYYGPVFYGMPMGYALNACAACQDTAIRSTVTYIGRGNVRYQVSPACTTGSTVTFIGRSRFAAH